MEMCIFVVWFAGAGELNSIVAIANNLNFNIYSLDLTSFFQDDFRAEKTFGSYGYQIDSYCTLGTRH